MAEEPQDSKFDTTDLETTSPETPKAKQKRAKTEEVTIRRGPKPADGLSLPGVHERPKKKGRKVSSEGKINASAAGTIGIKSEVEEALDMVRETSALSARDAQLAKEENLKMRSEMASRVDADMAAEDARIARGGKTDVEQSLDELRGMEEDRSWDENIAAAKKKADEDGQVIEFEAEPASDEERAEIRSEELEWDKKIAAAKEKAAEEERAIAAYAEAHPEARPMNAEFSQDEEAWFKKGEDAGHVKAQAERQQAEEGVQIKDVRRQIAESYDRKTSETILDTDQEIEAAAKQAQAMISSGELNAEMFNAKDYRYLLTQQARIDHELESAGWWSARKLRAELKEVRKELVGYEQQIQGAFSGRTASGALTARDKEDIRYKGPMPKQALPKGSGTTVHKPSLFSRLFGKK